MKILVVGDIYFESQYFVDNIPSENQFTFSQGIKNMIGSKTINASRVLSKLGNEVYFYGKVGDDSFGSLTIETFDKEYLINSNYIEKISNSNTGQITVITNQEGKSSVTLYSGANKLFKEKDLGKISEIVNQFDLIYCATNLQLDYLYSLVELANKNNVLIFIDVPNQHKLIDLDKLSIADFIAPNRQEAELLLSMKIENLVDADVAVKKLREKCEGNIIITLDKDGCILLEKGKIESQHYSTFEVKQVDATGSGDIFRAVLVSEYLKSKSLDSAIKKGLEIATESVKIKGVDNTIKILTLGRN